jgi:exopolysaccharide biosynthesis polyprenyl glycosylphosphotransferase
MMTTVQNLSIAPSQRLPMSPRQVAIVLLLSDILGLLVCTTIAVWLRLGRGAVPSHPIAYSFGLLILLGLYLANAYRPYENIAGLWSSSRVVIANGIVAIVISALLYLSHSWHRSPLAWRSILFPSLLLFTIWAVCLRQMMGLTLRSWAKKSAWLLIGQDQLAEQFQQDFQTLNPYSQLTIMPSDNADVTAAMLAMDQLPQRYSGIIIQPEVQLSESHMQQLMQLRFQGSVICQLPDFYEVWWQRVPPATLHDTWFTFGAGFDLVTGRFGLKLKRVIDILAAWLLLLLLAPIMLIVAIVIKLDSPGSIFYSQRRNGLNHQPFLVRKFRSMYQDAEKRGAQWAQKQDPRITRVGYFLRLSRIDELPQLWNVLMGDMSLIGPRPERPEFDERLTAKIPYYHLRYLVKPGITGWAQVMYPYGASIEDAYEKLSYDLYYIKNYSIWLDLAIVFKTLRVVLLGKGR